MNILNIDNQIDNAIDVKIDNQIDDKIKDCADNIAGVIIENFSSAPDFPIEFKSEQMNGRILKQVIRRYPNGELEIFTPKATYSDGNYNLYWNGSIWAIDYISTGNSLTFYNAGLDDIYPWGEFTILPFKKICVEPLIVNVT